MAIDRWSNVVHGVLLLIERTLTLNQVFYRNGFQHRALRLFNLFPDLPQQEMLPAFPSFMSMAVEGTSMKNRSIERFQNISHGKLRGILEQEIAALRTANTVNEPGLFHRMKDLFEKSNRDRLPLGNRPRLYRLAFPVHGQVNSRHNSIGCAMRDSHS